MKIMYVFLRIATVINVLLGILAVACLNIPVAIIMLLAAGITDKISKGFTKEEE